MKEIKQKPRGRPVPCETDAIGKIKTRTAQTVNTFNRAQNLAGRTKQAVEQEKSTSLEKSAEESAVDSVTDYAKGVTHRARNAKRGLQKARQEAKTAYQNLKKAKKPAEKTRQTTRTSHKTIKTAGRATIKTAKAAGKTVKTAKLTAKGTKFAVKGGKVTIKATVAATKGGIITAKLAFIKAKLVAKAVIATVKLAIAAVKALFTVLAAGGWVVVVIILVIALVGWILSSPIGIFGSNDWNGSDADIEFSRTMPEVVMALTAEFYSQVDDIAARNPHDVLEVGAINLRWEQILAVYAVKVTMGDEFGLDISFLGDEQVEMIRTVLYDMASLSYSLREVILESGTETEDGYRDRITQIILSIFFQHRNPDEMAVQYGFNDDQREQLHELLDPELAGLWAELLGRFMPGGGEILTGNENFIPLGKFAWPLAGNWPITSPFGPRRSPGGIGSTNHRGIDIGAPTGTPILASAGGEVIQVRNNDQGGWGLFVIIDHGGGYQTIYAHNSRNFVSRGDIVVQGQVIAEIGSTGTSTGPHLHFEIRRNGTAVDPLSFFRW